MQDWGITSGNLRGCLQHMCGAAKGGTTASAGCPVQLREHAKRTFDVLPLLLCQCPIEAAAKKELAEGCMSSLGTAAVTGIGIPVLVDQRYTRFIQSVDDFSTYCCFTTGCPSGDAYDKGLVHTVLEAGRTNTHHALCHCGLQQDTKLQQMLLAVAAGTADEQQQQEEEHRNSKKTRSTLSRACTKQADSH